MMRGRAIEILRGASRAFIAIVLVAMVALASTGAARGQGLGPMLPDDAPEAATPVSPIDVLTPGMNLSVPPSAVRGLTTSTNPLEVLADAARLIPGAGGSPASMVSTPDDGNLRPRGLSSAINIILLLTVITLVPSVLLMCTSFLRIVIVLALLKQALGTAQMPPSQTLLGLSLILTLLVMSPTLERINREALVPYRAGEVSNYDELWERVRQPMRDFMFDQIEATGNWSSLYSIMNYRGIDTSDPSKLTRADVDMITLIPAFVMSELKVAFLMGFRVYLPFLVIDMVISTLLISMSMMMLPPVLISLPFKLLLFVLVDVWQLVCGSLLQSFVVHPTATASSGAAGDAAQASIIFMPLYEGVRPVLTAIGLA
ncbi:MAG: flagellar type III secretion system pore protein FliP [Phycisphaerales bacterium]